MEQKYLEENKIDNSEFLKALDSINKEEEYTDLDYITQIIDETDKYSDLYALSISGVFFSISLLSFLSNLGFILFLDPLVMFSLLFFLVSIIFCIWQIIRNKKRLNINRENLSFHRINSSDKELLYELYEKRKSDNKVGIMIGVITLLLSIVVITILASTLILDYVFAIFYLLFTFGMFVILRTNGRRKNINILLDTSQD